MTDENKKLNTPDEANAVFSKLINVCHERQNKRMQEWQTLFGPRLNDMLCSRHAADLALVDRDEQTRLAAYGMELFHWKPTLERFPTYINAAVNDTNEFVRLRAIHCLAIILKGSSHVDASRVLATIVKDLSNPTKLRASAYWALCEIQRFGAQKDWWELPTEKRQESFEAQVNWDFVNNICNEYQL